MFNKIKEKINDICYKFSSFLATKYVTDILNQSDEVLVDLHIAIEDELVKRGVIRV